MCRAYAQVLVKERATQLIDSDKGIMNNTLGTKHHLVENKNTPIWTKKLVQSGNY